MQRPLTVAYCPIERANSQDSKLWDQIREILEKHDSQTIFERILNPVFDSLPDRELLEALEQTRHTGRPGYPVRVMWRTMVAMYVLNCPSYSQLIRELRQNPALASVCGINSYEGIPSKYAYSRFLAKIEQRRFIKLVKNVQRNLTRILYKMLPNFGKSTAIDSTTIKAWSNGGKTPHSDPDAGWSVKKGTDGKSEYCFGYKLHALIDTEYELPIAANVTPGNFNDSRIASHVLAQARFTYGKFHPKYVICDAGYSSNKLRRLIKRQYLAEPIIKVNKAHKKAVFPETSEWLKIYNRRGAVERMFSRLKGQRKLNDITVRGRKRVTIHCFLSIMVIQSEWLARHDVINGDVFSLTVGSS